MTEVRANACSSRLAPLLALLFSLATGPAALPAAQPAPDYAAAVNTAGRQRMLTQRIVKAYCAVGQEVLPERSRRQLAEAVEIFERQLGTLAALTVDAPARAAIDRVRELWRDFRPLATGEVVRDRVAELASRSEELLEASHALVLELERAGGTPVARLVNVAGRQRMLSQRLAKLYFLRAWGFRGAQLDTALQTATDEFVAGLQLLSSAPQNTTQMLEELAAVNLQWTWFEYAIGLEGARTYLLVVDDSSESILNSMEAITAMYETLGRR